MPLRTFTTHTYRPNLRSKETGFGGFPTPFYFIGKLVGRVAPNIKRQLTRTVTMPRTHTLISHVGDVIQGATSVPYISFDAIVGRNSTFRDLTNEQLEELGGVEFRALNALLWIVPTVNVVRFVLFLVCSPATSITLVFS